MSEFTEEKKAKALLILNKIVEDDKDKFHVYHDVYHAVMDSCNSRITENEILPERENLLRFLH
jgi:Zn-dependent peptidase ImmA (M78 family)